jgi:tetratricopeptide (TPR) repeat protein
MIYKRFLTTLPVIFALIINGCASFGSGSNNSSDEAEDATPSTAVKQEAPTRSFEGDTLFELLLAEFAGKRNRADVALGKYLKQAHETKDPQVVERAAFIARYLGAHQATLDASILWTEIEPNNPVPRELAAIELIRFGKLDEAMTQIDLLMASNGKMNFEYLLQASRSSNQETRKKILDKLRQYSQSINDDKLWFAKGSLEAMDGMHENAIADYNNALKITPNYGNAILARAQSLIATNQLDKAMAYLAKQTSLWPENKRLGVSYARYLMQQGQLEAAQQQFYRLSKSFPHDGDLVLSLALLSWENQQKSDAKQYFQQLLEMNHRADEANIYLARIAASEKDYGQAQTHFQQVTVGPHFALAQIQLALLQQEQGNVDQAIQTLNLAEDALPKDKTKFIMAKSEVLANAERVEEAVQILDGGLTASPDDTNMLYSRAMLREQLDDFEGMEADLRKVLELQPNNSAALNALGYTFADRNHRLSEAWELIERAYTLNPKDPAIIDSMGWIKYRLGETQVALDFLRKAYEAFDDQEIAAHLGEVLWVTGQREEAAIIWRNSLEKNPKSHVLKEVMQRFLPDSI